MQQWMSALLDYGFVAVKNLKDKQGWLTKRGVTGDKTLLFTGLVNAHNGGNRRRLY